MKTTKTRILAAVCAAATFLLLMPATAFAATYTGANFVNSAKDGVITLEDDTTLTSTAKISGNVTIDLNNHTLRSSKPSSNPNEPLLQITGGANVLITGPGTIKGDEWQTTNNLITVLGNSTLAIQGTEGTRDLTISGFRVVDYDKNADLGCAIKVGASNGSDGSSVSISNAIVSGGDLVKTKPIGLYYNAAGKAIDFYSTGTLSIENAQINGGNGVAEGELTGGHSNLFAKGNVALDLHQGTITVSNSTITGGNSDLYDAGDAISFSTGPGAKLTIDNDSLITGGSCVRPEGNYGIAGDAIEVTQNMKASSIAISDSEIKGGGGGNSWLGSGINVKRINDEVVDLTVSNSSIAGGSQGNGTGEGFGNAIHTNTSNPQSILIDLTDTTLSVDDASYNNSVIYSYDKNVPITASGAIKVEDGTLSKTTVTPGPNGVSIVEGESGNASVGENELTVLSNATVENGGATVYFPTAADAIQNAQPGSTVTITNVDEGETLPALPAGVEVKNETDESIVVGGQTVEPDATIGNYVAQIGDKGYVSLEAALADAKDGATVELLGNVESAGALTVPAGVTIDGKGNSITCASTIENGAFITAGGNNAVLKDLVVNTNGNAKHGVQFYCVDGGTLRGVTVNGGSYTSVIVNGATNIVLEDCVFNPDDGAYAHVEFAMGKNVTTVPSVAIDGASFEGPESAAKVWVDNSTVERIKEALGGSATNDQVLAKVKESIANNGSGSLDIAVQINPDGDAENIVIGGNVPPVPSPEYAINLAPGENGSLKADFEKAVAGKTVTITATPDTGFSIESVTVEDAKGASIEVTATEEGAFTFKMPASDVTVAASFVCDGGTLCPSRAFSDVDQSEWYHAAIDWAISSKTMNGFSGDLAGLFGPEMDLTRAQMAQILWNLEGNPAATLSSSFSDVSQDDWFYGPIAWAVNEGIYRGYEGTGFFGPNDALTREQAAAVLMRWSEKNGQDVSARADLSVYPDADEVSEWAVECMSWAVGSGTLIGIESPEGTLTLDPQATSSRAMAAMLMMRLAA